MASPRQILANQANSRLATGPKTPEGKARSAHNAVRHGLTARDVVVLDGEREEFESFLESFRAELAPDGILERTVFDQIVRASWNMRRIRRLESSLTPGSDPLSHPSPAGALDRFTRYFGQAERSFYRALKELKQLQTARAARLAGPVQEDAPPLAAPSARG